ncbi:MAG: 50S ribosomal protein L31 [Planctomycetes bacterium]|nr:50S ribosomal protein L31 [Planctomycetota bacterium]
MKQNIHPKYEAVTVHCACGNEFQTRSTKPEIRVTLCNECHPFFTGKQKFVDTAGRIEKFQKRFNLTEGVATAEVGKAQKVKSKKQAQAAAIQEEKRLKAARKTPKKSETAGAKAEEPAGSAEASDSAAAASVAAPETPAAPAPEAPAGDAPAAEEYPEERHNAVAQRGGYRACRRTAENGDHGTDLTRAPARHGLAHVCFFRRWQCLIPK